MNSTAVYIRVSSKRQDTASQEPDVRRYLAANGLEGAPTYRDKFTGRTMERPGFQKLLTAIRAGEVKNVIVWRLDRLGRTASGLADLFAELNTRKVNLVSIRDGLDLSTPAGRLMGHVLASVAEYETEVRAERVLAGLEAARERGVHLGRPAGVHTAVKVTAEQTAQMRRLRREKKGVSAIARAVGLSRPTVYRILGYASHPAL
jgi:DNA invertase Pin-like site-specific DNA recombinase